MGKKIFTILQWKFLFDLIMCQIDVQAIELYL